MQLIPRGRLRANYFRGSIPYQTQPAISLPDISVNAVAGNAADLQGVTVDAHAGCIYAKPFFVPHNQSVWLLGAPFAPLDDDAHLNLDLPTWRWDLVEMDDGTETSPNNFEMQYFRGKTWGHQTLDVLWNSNTDPSAGIVTLTKVLGGEPPTEEELAEGGPTTYYPTIQGFVCFLSRAIYNKIPAGSEAYYEIRAEIGNYLYSLKISSAQYAQIRRSDDDGATWKILAAAVKIGGSMTDTMGSKPPDRGQNPLVFEFLVINKTLQIKIGSQQVPYTLPVTYDEHPEITKVIVEAQCFTQFNAEIHPLKFGTEVTMVSNPLTIGFSPVNTPYYRIAGLSSIVTRASGVPWNLTWPEDSQVIVENAGLPTDIDQQYLLTLINAEEGTYAGYPYAGKTGAVTRVAIEVDGIWAVVPTAPANLIPKEVNESIRFDPNNLTIDQHCSFTLNNYYGQWRGQSGHIVTSLELGYAQPFTALFPRFTGLCGRYEFNRPASNIGTVTFECESFMKMLRDARLLTVPVMDGWNHYYAIAFLAQMAGVSVAQMAFSAMIPSDPYSASGWDPAPYFLPLGEGMRPWTPRNRESPALDMMNYVRKPTGFLLFFDAQGYLRYEKWQPFAPGTTVKLFTEGPSGFEGSNVSEYFQLRLISDVDDVRNQVMLVGRNMFDPGWRLIISNKIDNPSIYASPGFEPKNYVGYRKPFIWTDSRFADLAFADEGSSRLLEMLRVPTLEATFETWLQPHLYPMDVIFINDSKSGTEGVPFYITEVCNRWGIEGQKQIARTQITGKFLVA